MKTCTIAALALASILPIAALRADDTAGSTSLVPNNHGGYNVVENGAMQGGGGLIPFFGPHGYASHVKAEGNAPKSFLLKPVVQGTGHDQHTVYHKVFYASPADAEAAKMAQ